MKKIYLVHCGFYDTSLLDGVYESHVNFLVVADSFEDARARVKLESDFKERKMHVDGLQEVNSIQGYRISLVEDQSLNGKTELISNRHRDLAPKPNS